MTFWGGVGVAVVLVVAVFLLLRAFWLWYWRVGEIADTLHAIRADLAELRALSSDRLPASRGGVASDGTPRAPLPPAVIPPSPQRGTR